MGAIERQIRTDDLIAAAEIVSHQFQRLCDCVDEFEPEDMAACSEHRDALDDALFQLGERIVAYRISQRILPPDSEPE